MTAIIYYDTDDADTDGNGWSVLNGPDGDDLGTLRFATLRDARRWCLVNNLRFEVYDSPG